MQRLGRPRRPDRPPGQLRRDRPAGAARGRPAAGAEARLVPTDAWAEKVGRRPGGQRAASSRASTGPGAPTPRLDRRPAGGRRSASPGATGRTVSPPRRGGGEAAPADPALLIDETKGGRCPCVVARGPRGRVRPRPASRTPWPGMGARGGKPGTLLVEDGQDRGATAQVAPTERHPRTAAGVSRDGRTLLLAGRGRPAAGLERRRHPAGARAR